MPPYESLSYRPCVGTAVFNREGLVFIGHRVDGPEHTDERHVWQLPDGTSIELVAGKTIDVSVPAQ